MTHESDAILARCAGLANDDRYALDNIANADPRLCKAALYDHARAIANALSDDDLRDQIEDLKSQIVDLEKEVERANEEAGNAMEDRDRAEAQARIDADDASRYKAFLDKLVEDIALL